MGNLNAWKLPWQGKMVPHGVLDILRGCNISCRACYNTRAPSSPKSLATIQEELEGLLRFRRLNSVSILGGEVALHPRLCEIISLVHQKGLHVELITNGLAMDRPMMADLAAAGLSVIYFHMERGQQRPDLPADHSFDDINRLRLEKAALASECGLDVGLTLTIYPGEFDELRSTLALVLQSPVINYLLVTLFRDTSSIEYLQGDISAGIHGKGGPPPAETRRCLKELAAWLEEELDLTPFAYVGANLDPDEPRWLSYLVATMTDTNGGHWYRSVQASLVEKMAMLFYRMVKRRYPMYMEQDPDQFRSQLLFNGLFSGNLKAHRKFIDDSKQPGTRLSAKRILFQNPAELTENGTLLHCQCCPDAVIKNGGLVPVCIADKVR